MIYFWLHYRFPLSPAFSRERVVRAKIGCSDGRYLTVRMYLVGLTMNPALYQLHLDWILKLAKHLLASTTSDT